MRYCLTTPQPPADSLDSGLRLVLTNWDESPLLAACTRYRPRTDNFKQIVISAQAMAALRDGGQLNDEAVYAGMAVLAEIYSSRLHKLAIMSTFPYTAYCDSTAISRIFTSLRDTKFWDRDIIVIPIHAGQHWMMAVVYLATGRVEIFDSLAQQGSWEVHGRVSSRRWHTNGGMLTANHEQKVATFVWALLNEAQSQGLPLRHPTVAAWSCMSIAVRYLMFRLFAG